MLRAPAEGEWLAGGGSSGVATPWRGRMLRAMFAVRRSNGTSASRSERLDSDRPDYRSALTDQQTVDAVIGEVERERLRARELATFYAGAYRSSYLVIALLGVIAVALASFPLPESTHVVTGGALPASRAVHLDLRMTLALAELLVIVAMFTIYYRDRCTAAGRRNRSITVCCRSATDTSQRW